MKETGESCCTSEKESNYVRERVMKEETVALLRDSVAVCFIVLQCVSLCCSVFHCVAVCCIVLQCVSLC